MALRKANLTKKVALCMRNQKRLYAPAVPRKASLMKKVALCMRSQQAQNAPVVLRKASLMKKVALCMKKTPRILRTPRSLPRRISLRQRMFLI